MPNNFDKGGFAGLSVSVDHFNGKERLMSVQADPLDLLTSNFRGCGSAALRLAMV